MTAPGRAEIRVGRATWSSTAIRSLLAENALLVALIAALAAVLLVAGPALLVADSWLALVAGREIAQHGLPSHDSLVLLSHGVRWVDQQWLAQLFFYGAWKVGGIRLAVLVDVALVLTAFGSAVVAARRRGASQAAVLAVSALCVIVAPWSWQLRPQTLALPLFVWTIVLLTQDVRRPRPRTYLVFPLLILWANLHGTVVFAAILTALAGATAIVRDRRLTPRAALFLALPWPCVLASPYALHLPGYFKLMLVDPPFARFIVEWQPARPSAVTAAFYVLLAVAVVLAVRSRGVFTPFELAVLALAAVEAIHAVRAIALFVLAAQVLLPSALRRTGERRRQSRFAVPLAVVLLLAVVVAFTAAAAHSQSWYQRYWPERLATTVRNQPRTAHVFPSDRYADWLLWRIPSMRGRIAYDVRFELLDTRVLDALYRNSKQRGQRWQAVTNGFGVVVLDLPRRRAQLRALLAEPDYRLVYEKKDDVAVVVRRCRTSLGKDVGCIPA